jgi:hypothetical protein
MDDSQAFSGDINMEQDFPSVEEPRMEAPPPISAEERRMHVRAYNYWVSLLDGRPYPSIEDLDPANIEDFGPHSVLLDFTSGPDHAAIPFLGAALREEGGIGDAINMIDDVPARSVLSRLTDHYLEIIANRAPIGFEAEYVNHRDLATMYRGILMPFSSDGDTIDFIYGVINWKEVAAIEVADDIREAVHAAFTEPAVAPPVAPIWADGPHAQALDDVIDLSDADLENVPFEDEMGEAVTELSPDAPLYDRLAVARESADALAQTDQRSRAALYRALGEAYDFAFAAASDQASYAEILEDAGLKMQDRAPMTPIVKLIFGTTYDKTRLAEYAAVLSHAHRHELAFGAVPQFLNDYEGGLKAIVKAERALRRPSPQPDRETLALAGLVMAPVLATLTLDGVDGDYVSMIGRREADGSIAIITIENAQSAQLIRAAKGL